MNKRDLLKYTVAFLYGDGGVYKHGKECRFDATASTEHMDYVLWRKTILEEITPVNLYLIKRENPNHQDLVKTTSRTHPWYSKLRERLYVDNAKNLDPFYFKLMDWETLAIWFMDDGTLNTQIGSSGNLSQTVLLATHAYGYSGTTLLKKWFKEVYDLEWNLAKSGIYYQLRLLTRDYPKFDVGVRPFIKDSFMYKLVQHDKPQ